MSVVMVVLTLALLVWALWFVAKGLSHGMRLLRPPGGERSREEHVEREIGMVLLGGVVGVLIGTALFIVVLVTRRESQALDLQAKIAQMEAKVQVYEEGLARLERALEGAAKESRESGDRFATDIRQELFDLRKRLAGGP